MDYLQRLAKVLPSFQIRLLVYCLMTNHLHLLVQDARGGGLPFAMQKIQGGFAQAWNRRRRRSGHVWGERYYPEPVESDEHLIGGSLYMHTNPNEAGMVTDARAYRWSSVGAYTSGHSDIPVSTDLILELCGGPRRYAELLKDSQSAAYTNSGGEHLPDATKIRNLWTAGSPPFRERAESLLERRVERRSFNRRPRGKGLDQIIAEVCREKDIGVEELSGPKRTRRISAARSLVCALAEREGIPATEVAGELRLTRSAVTQLASKSHIDPFVSIPVAKQLNN